MSKNITRIVIGMDDQDSSNVGWAYWAYYSDGEWEDIDSSGPLGTKGRRNRTITSLRRQLARESGAEFAKLLRQIGDNGFSWVDRHGGYWEWRA